MIVPAILTWAAPMVLAIIVGWWRGKELIETPRMFFRQIGIGVLWIALGTFAVHLVCFAAIKAATGGIGSLGALAGTWTILTAAFWVPVLVITLALRALKTRKAAAAMRDGN